MNIQKIFGAAACALLLVLPGQALAAAIDNVRASVSPARVRFVLDSAQPIAYEVEKKGASLVVKMPASSAKKRAVAAPDAFIKSAQLAPQGREGSVFTIKLARDAQYKAYRLQNPERLVLDIFRINVVKQEQKLAEGVSYTYLQDEMNGRQIQAYLLTVAKDAPFELRPFSAAGTYNGRGYVSRQAAKLRLPAAVNASYFDSDGWVIGNTKDRGMTISMDFSPRSGYADADGQRMVLEDLSYDGEVTLPDGKRLRLKGVNRARIAEDLVMYNEYYATSTKTNQFGREIKVRGGKVTAVSTAGNMTIEPGSYVISGHGANAAALAKVRVGDRILLTETLGSELADAAQIVVGAGPRLLNDGKVNVRSSEENIAPDIAKGRAPRTAVGIKKDGTVLVLVVDGRSNSSAGLTLTELAQYFLRLGAREAVNFDGGGSSVMVINGGIVNRPSDGSERPVSIGLGLFPKI